VKADRNILAQSESKTAPSNGACFHRPLVPTAVDEFGVITLW
jgi:hypothetical protein